LTTRKELMAPLRVCEIDLAEQISDLRFDAHENGAHVLVRLRGRPVGVVWLKRDEGGVVPADVLRAQAEAACRDAIARLATFLELHSPGQASLDLTVAICTRARPALLRRCLEALTTLADERRRVRPDDRIDLLVVDNAPPDDATRAVVSEFSGVAHVIEPVPGLNFGRNAALRASQRRWIAYVDDDAVIDRLWFDHLAEGVEATPDAGAFTGPIMPLMLETEAQFRFERSGGFGKGFMWEHNAIERWGDRCYPLGAGRFGTGACMVFRTDLMRALGGFDEALDTGPPLPGGGDIDAFFSVVTSGNPLVYLPGLMVRHEHRRDMKGLRRQYWSWGVATTALIAKTAQKQPELRHVRQQLYLWLTSYYGARIWRSLRRRNALTPGAALAECVGAVQGALGEYGRSRRRSAALAERVRAGQTGGVHSYAP
jgi:GT2 family glycosyltransferase